VYIRDVTLIVTLYTLTIAVGFLQKSKDYSHFQSVGVVPEICTLEFPDYANQATPKTTILHGMESYQKKS